MRKTALCFYVCVIWNAIFPVMMITTTARTQTFNSNEKGKPALSLRAGT